MKLDELKSAVEALRELGLSYKEATDAIQGVSNEIRSVRGLWRKGNKSKLIKLGLSLIVFPEPTPISETLGAAVLATGLIHNKVKQSNLHIDDVYSTFQEVIRDLQTIKHGLDQ
jgi:hypothetical protein